MQLHFAVCVCVQVCHVVGNCDRITPMQTFSLEIAYRTLWELIVHSMNLQIETIC